MRVLLLCSSLVIVAILALILPASEQARVPVRAPLAPAIHVEEGEENPREREEWEWQRSRDPATGIVPRGIARAERAFAATLPKHLSMQSAPGLHRRAADAYEWQERGPSTVGGRTRALALDVGSPGTIVAGGITGGMWRSVDNGSSWTRTTHPSQNPNVSCVAQDVREGKRNVWYCGTGEFRSNSGRFGNTGLIGDGIYKSTDSARSWQPLPSTISNTLHSLDSPFDFVHTIVTDASKPDQDVVYAACHGAIMRSTDGGTSWQEVLGAPGEASGYTSVVISPTGTLYAALGSGDGVEGVWRSRDGVQWANITPQFWPDSCRRILLASAPSDENVLYVFAETPGSGLPVQGFFGFTEYYSFWKYTYTSGNGTGTGGTWSDRSDNLPQMNGQWVVNGLNSYTMALAVAPDNPETVYLGCTNLFVSRNGFAGTTETQWLGGYDESGNSFYDGSLHPDIHIVLPIANGTGGMYVGGDGGVAFSESPALTPDQWVPMNNGYVTGQIYAIALDRDTPGSPLLLNGMQDNGSHLSTENALVPWSFLIGGDGCFCAFADSGRTYYVSFQGGRIYAIRTSPNSGPTFARVDPNGGAGYLFVAPFELDPLDDRAMYLPAGPSLWYNSNLDEIPEDPQQPAATVNWAKLVQVSSTISALGLSTAAPHSRVYLGTSNGNVYRLDNANLPNRTLTLVTSPQFPKGAYVNCVAVDPHDGNTALVVFTNYSVQSLFLTTDGGSTWSAVGGNLEEFADGSGRGPSCRWAAFLHSGATRRVFVATTVGLYSTTTLNGLETVWEQEGAETIGVVRVDMIRTRESDGAVAVGTWGRGAFTTVIPTSGVDHEEVIAGFTLENAVPNPVRSQARIGFTIPERAGTQHVRLCLYDVVGNEVACLLDETMSPGTHSAAMNTAAGPLAGLPGGSYFCRLSVAGTAIARPVTLVR